MTKVYCSKYKKEIKDPICDSIKVWSKDHLELNTHHLKCYGDSLQGGV